MAGEGGFVRAGKVDLAAELLPEVTWRQARDALKRLDQDTPHGDALGIALSLPALGAALAADEGRRLASAAARDLFRFDELLDREPRLARARWPRAVAAIEAARELGARVAAVLEASGHLAPGSWKDEPVAGRWQLTPLGATLLAQKALARIPRARGVALLRKAVAAAVAYNDEDGPNFHIARLHLFGSLLRGEATVGDVDIVAETAWRWPGEPFEERRRKERERLLLTRPSALAAIWWSTELEGPQRVNRVSPHVSVVARDSMLAQLAEGGEPHRAVYVLVPARAGGPEADDARRLSAEAAAFLAELA